MIDPMNAAAFDSLQFVRILRDKGSFTTEQAESIADAMASTLHDDLATKADLQANATSLEGKMDGVEQRLEGKISGVEQRLEAKISGVEQRLEGKIRESQLRLESKIAETKSDIVKWMFGTIGFQTLVMIGAIITLRAQRCDQAVKLLAVARLAFDVGDQAFCRQMGEDALVPDLDDVDIVGIELFHHLEQRAGAVLQR